MKKSIFYQYIFNIGDYPELGIYKSMTKEIFQVC